MTPEFHDDKKECFNAELIKLRSQYNQFNSIIHPLLTHSSNAINAEEKIAISKPIIKVHSLEETIETSNDNAIKCLGGVDN